MSIFAIDFGTKHLGFAIGYENSVCSPLKSITYNSYAQALNIIQNIINDYEVKEIVIGLPLSRGKIGSQAKLTKKFGQKLAKDINLPIHYQNETLSSHDAVQTMIRVGVPKQKRKRIDHAFAAKLILDEYLEERRKG